MTSLFHLVNFDCNDHSRKVFAKVTITLIGMYAGNWGNLDRGDFNRNNYKLLKEVCVCYISLNLIFKLAKKFQR